MSRRNMSYASKKTMSDIKYEHILRAGRGLSMANDVNPDRQEDNRLALTLQKLDKHREAKSLERPSSLIARSSLTRPSSLPSRVRAEPNAAQRRAQLAQSRLCKTLDKYQIAFPILRKSREAAAQQVMAESSKARPYTRLYNAERYSQFCQKVSLLCEESREMRRDLAQVTKLAQMTNLKSGNTKKQEEYKRRHSKELLEFDEKTESVLAKLPKEQAAEQRIAFAQEKLQLKEKQMLELKEKQMLELTDVPDVGYCGDINLYLRQQSQYNTTVDHVEQQEIHWEQYRRNRVLKRVTFVPGNCADIAMSGYLSFSGYSG